jgi:hypothetical protein
MLRQQEAKRDYIAAQGAMVADIEGDELVMGILDNTYQMTDYAHRQMASRLGIPVPYWDRMRREFPELLLANVDTWLKHEPGKKVMARTLDGRVRAILSDSYRPLDNDMILEAAFPVLQETNLKVTASAMSDTHLYIQAVTSDVEGEVKPGDVVRAGITLSNSEVGAGSVKVEQTIWRLVCSNGLITGRALRRNHVGKKNGRDLGQSAVHYQADTQEAENKAFLLKIRDTVKHAISDEGFRETLSNLREAAETKFTKTIPEVVDVTQKRFSLPNKESESVLTHLAAGGDLTKWGLTNAVTRTAQDVNADRAVDLERLAADIIELSASQWNELYMN